MPNHRQSRARRVVKGMAALEPAPHRNRFRVKNTEKHILGQGNSKREKERDVCCVCEGGGGGGGGVKTVLVGHQHIQVECTIHT